MGTKIANSAQHTSHSHHSFIEFAVKDIKEPRNQPKPALPRTLPSSLRSVADDIQDIHPERNAKPVLINFVNML